MTTLILTKRRNACRKLFMVLVFGGAWYLRLQVQGDLRKSQLVNPRISEPKDQHHSDAYPKKDQIVPQSSAQDIVKIEVREEICPRAKRFGTESAEGGWFVCDPESLAASAGKGDCVVYSFGIRGDYKFDSAVNAAGCQVHGFEPSPDEIPKSKPSYEKMGAHFHSYGLGLADGVIQPGNAPFRWPGIGYLRDTNTLPWTLKRLPTIMKENGNRHLQMLKIDTEGAEWDSWEDIVASSWDEFATELHFPPNEYQIVYGSNCTAVKRNKKAPKFHEKSANPTWLDRIPLLHKMLAVADVWKIEPNPNDKQCLNIYFKKKKQ